MLHFLLHQCDTSHWKDIHSRIWTRVIGIVCQFSVTELIQTQRISTLRIVTIFFFIINEGAPTYRAISQFYGIKSLEMGRNRLIVGWRRYSNIYRIYSIYRSIYTDLTSALFNFVYDMLGDCLKWIYLFNFTLHRPPYIMPSTQRCPSWVALVI